MPLPFHLKLNKAFLVIVAVSFVIRLIGLNLMGRTWDEYAYIGDGYKLVQSYLHGHWRDPIWLETNDHPPLARYLYGLAGMFNYIGSQNEQPVFSYDWTAPRLLSALTGSLAIGCIYLIGLQLFNPTVALLSALTATLIPFVIGDAQLATVDTLVLTGWALTLYTALRLGRKPITTKKAIFFGLALALTLLTKYTNVLIIPMLILTWYLYFPRRSLRRPLLIAGLTTIVVCLLLWPPLLNSPRLLFVRILNRTTGAHHSPAETFLGQYQAVPPSYYLVYLVISLPPALLLASGYGLSRLTADRRRFVILISWLLIPLLLSFYPIRRNGLRYVIPIIIPISLYAGFGLSKLSPSKSELLIPAYFISIIFGLVRVYPYYLDYFNLFVGGPKNVYNHRLFNLGWWGEGQRAAMFWLANHLKYGDTLGLAVAPISVAPSFKGIPTGRYDLQPHYPFTYLVFNSLWEMDQRFDYSIINNDYREVHQVTAAGAPLVRIFARTSPIPPATPSATPTPTP